MYFENRVHDDVLSVSDNFSNEKRFFHPTVSLWETSNNDEDEEEENGDYSENEDTTDSESLSDTISSDIDSFKSTISSAVSPFSSLIPAANRSVSPSRPVETKDRRKQEEVPSEPLEPSQRLHTALRASDPCLASIDIKSSPNDMCMRSSFYGTSTASSLPDVSAMSFAKLSLSSSITTRASTTSYSTSSSGIENESSLMQPPMNVHPPSPKEMQTSSPKATLSVPYDNSRGSFAASNGKSHERSSCISTTAGAAEEMDHPNHTNNHANNSPRSLSVSSLHVLQLAEDNEWDEVLEILSACPSLSSNIDIFQMTCLHWACTDPSIPFETLQKILLYNPEQANQCNASGMYPVHIALTYQLPDSHNLLLIEYTHVAVMWTQDSAGNLPIDIANTQDRSAKLMKLLSSRRRHSSATIGSERSSWVRSSTASVRSAPSSESLSHQFNRSSSVSSMSCTRSNGQSYSFSSPYSEDSEKYEMEVDNIQEIGKSLQYLLEEIKGIKDVVQRQSTTESIRRSSSVSSNLCTTLSNCSEPCPSPSPFALYAGDHGKGNNNGYNLDNPECSHITSSVTVRWNTSQPLGISFQSAFRLSFSSNDPLYPVSCPRIGACIKRFTKEGSITEGISNAVVGDFLYRINGKNMLSRSFRRIMKYLQRLADTEGKIGTEECVLEFLHPDGIRRNEVQQPSGLYCNLQKGVYGAANDNHSTYDSRLLSQSSPRSPSMASFSSPDRQSMNRIG